MSVGTLIFLILGIVLLVAAYVNGRLIGPGLASLAIAVYLVPHL